MKYDQPTFAFKRKSCATTQKCLRCLLHFVQTNSMNFETIWKMCDVNKWTNKNLFYAKKTQREKTTEAQIYDSQIRMWMIWKCVKYARIQPSAMCIVYKPVKILSQNYLEIATYAVYVNGHCTLAQRQKETVESIAAKSRLEKSGSFMYPIRFSTLNDSRNCFSIRHCPG